MWVTTAILNIFSNLNWYYFFSIYEAAGDYSTGVILYEHTAAQSLEPIITFLHSPFAVIHG